jgi:hypothetical protein
LNVLTSQRNTAPYRGALPLPEPDDLFPSTLSLASVGLESQGVSRSPVPLRGAPPRKATLDHATVPECSLDPSGFVGAWRLISAGGEGVWRIRQKRHLGGDRLAACHESLRCTRLMPEPSFPLSTGLLPPVTTVGSSPPKDTDMFGRKFIIAVGSATVAGVLSASLVFACSTHPGSTNGDLGDAHAHGGATGDGDHGDRNGHGHGTGRTASSSGNGTGGDAAGGATGVSPSGGQPVSVQLSGTVTGVSVGGVGGGSIGLPHVPSSSPHSLVTGILGSVPPLSSLGLPTTHALLGTGPATLHSGEATLRGAVSSVQQTLQSGAAVVQGVVGSLQHTVQSGGAVAVGQGVAGSLQQTVSGLTGALTGGASLTGSASNGASGSVQVSATCLTAILGHC